MKGKSLLVGCALALLWANTIPEGYYRVSHALEFFVNDIGLAFFFALMTKEVVEATLNGGVLHPWRRAALPVAAALGGILMSAGIYATLIHYFAEPMLMQGWAVTCAIDVAACYFVGNAIFGRHPAVPFLILLTIASNAVGLIILATIAPAPPLLLVAGLVLIVGAIGSAAIMRRRGVKSFWPYVIGPGVLCWYGMYLSGLHPALALVPIVPFMPHGAHADGLFVDAGPKATDALSRFVRWWTPPVHGVMFLFGLVNAGVPLHGLDGGMWAVPVATLIGRPLGVLLAAELAIAAGLHRTARIEWRELLVIGSVASIGLTLALFFASAVVSIGPLRMELRSGALLTALGAGIAWTLARVFRVGHFADMTSNKAS